MTPFKTSLMKIALTLGLLAMIPFVHAKVGHQAAQVQKQAYSAHLAQADAALAGEQGVTISQEAQ